MLKLKDKNKIQKQNNSFDELALKCSTNIIGTFLICNDNAKCSSINLLIPSETTILNIPNFIYIRMRKQLSGSNLSIHYRNLVIGKAVG